MLTSINEPNDQSTREMNMKTMTEKKQGFKCKACGAKSETAKKCCGSAMEKSK
jgi:hypothetical protein